MTATEDYDVVVVGGGAGGVGAALGAAQAGARTLLLESAGFLGGAATLKSVQTYCGLFTISDEPRPAVLGASAQVIAKLRELGGVRGPVKFRGTFMLLDSEAVKFALDQVCADAGVEVILHAMVVRAQRDGGLVRSVTTTIIMEITRCAERLSWTPRESATWPSSSGLPRATAIMDSSI